MCLFMIDKFCKPLRERESYVTAKSENVLSSSRAFAKIFGSLALYLCLLIEVYSYADSILSFPLCHFAVVCCYGTIFFLFPTKSFSIRAHSLVFLLSLLSSWKNSVSHGPVVPYVQSDPVSSITVCSCLIPLVCFWLFWVWFGLGWGFYVCYKYLGRKVITVN